MRRFNRFLVLALALVIVFAISAGVWIYSSVPSGGGEYTVSGLTARAEIMRDDNGVAYIFAANDNDAAYALGFAHAQDRLWQMELQRRVGAGRLAEIVGARAVGTDRFMRTLGFYRAAQKSVDALAPEVRAHLEKYAAGVNAWIAGHGGALPPEFLLFGHRPEPWRPADSVVWGKLMGMRLSGNYRDELLRARLSAKLSAEKIGELWPGYPQNGPITELPSEFRSWPLRQLAAAAIGALGPVGAPVGASNAWVVGGSRAKGGKPLLASDPHLSFGAPILWYLARIVTPDRRLVGATVPGLPYVLLGHNGKVAWGFTATQSDLQDLFIERPDAADPAAYRIPGGTRKFVKRREVIRVKDGEDQSLEVRTTRHGPVVSDLFAGTDAILALAATFLDEGDVTAAALYRLNRAAGMGQVREALAKLHAPQINVLFADVDGQIGYVTAGRAPIRKNGRGLVPRPGWTGEFDWLGMIPFRELPHKFNPPSGLIVNANNKVVADGYPGFLSIDWAPPYRARRIEELLDRSAKHDFASFSLIQLDQVSAMARDLLPLLTGISPTGAAAANAIAMLRRWDGAMDRTRPEPLIFSAWLREINRAIYADELGDDFTAYFKYRPSFVKAVLTGAVAWCDDQTTAQAETCADILEQALTAALASLSARYGDEMASWRWGRAHFARFAHPILKNVPVLNAMTELKIENGGGNFTINRGTSRLTDRDDPHAQIHGPGYRAIYDLGDLDRSKFIIATGQSGNPLSRHYRDLLVSWRDGAYLFLDKDRAGLIAAGAPTFVLKPK